MAKLLSGTRIYGNASVDTFITVGTNVAAANVVVTNASRLGNITSGVWNGSSISTAFTDAKITSVAGQTGAISNTQLASAIITSGVLTTANVAEVTNLYFTDARVSTALSNQTLSNASFSGNVTASYFIGDGSLLTNLATATAPGGFENSTLTAFPSGDFGNLASSLDAFGVSLVPVYDCMEPEGSLLTVDLETLT